jgi:hypothetical protein
VAQHEETAVAAGNPHAWRNAVIAGAGAWCLLAVTVAVVLRSPMFTLSYIGPLCVGVAAAGLAASRMRVRWPAFAYPMVVAALATLVNAPVIDLLL